MPTVRSDVRVDLDRLKDEIEARLGEELGEILRRVFEEGEDWSSLEEIRAAIAENDEDWTLHDLLGDDTLEKVNEWLQSTKAPGFADLDLKVSLEDVLNQMPADTIREKLVELVRKYLPLGNLYEHVLEAETKLLQSLVDKATAAIFNSEAQCKELQAQLDTKTAQLEDAKTDYDKLETRTNDLAMLVDRQHEKIKELEIQLMSMS